MKKKTTIVGLLFTALLLTAKNGFAEIEDAPLPGDTQQDSSVTSPDRVSKANWPKERQNNANTSQYYAPRSKVSNKKRSLKYPKQLKSSVASKYDKEIARKSYHLIGKQSVSKRRTIRLVAITPDIKSKKSSLLPR